MTVIDILLFLINVCCQICWMESMDANSAEEQDL